jgi:hypothetical protein
MSELVDDCPRCGATEITFDLHAATVVAVQYQWQRWYEAFCVCRRCARSTVFVLSEIGIDEQKAITKFGLTKLPSAANGFVRVERYISAKDRPPIQPPEHLPDNIQSAFAEGATCLSVDCFNAAGTMFRLCVDFSTSALLPEQDVDGLTKNIRRSLGLRLHWLFEHERIPEVLRDLSHCIKEDGNDGAHEGTLSKPDAEDLLDFTTALLERLYTEPRRLEIAKERRATRRSQ